MIEFSLRKKAYLNKYYFLSPHVQIVDETQPFRIKILLIVTLDG